MAQDKRNFIGGLNRDDDSRVVPNGDYFFAQNVRITSSEDRNSQLVENLRGMTKENYTRVFGSKEGSFGGDGSEYRVIGAYKDEPNNSIYYFIFSELFFHMILEYNIKNDFISTVYRDTGTQDNLLRFDKDTLITGVNRIDDLLYWTCDNKYVKSQGVELSFGRGRAEFNEPKFINVEKAKTGFNTYNDGGDYSVNPRTDFSLETSYPFEFFTSPIDGNEEVDSWRKRAYINVHKRRPKHAPVYFPQTPLTNNTSATINVNDIDGDAKSFTPGEVASHNISFDVVNATSGLDLAYKKNNVYGFTWQFAYRYVYRDNEFSSWSEWSAVTPLPQYYQNAEDKDKQNLYNELRIWYHNGPGDVKHIEIAARKCQYAETAPDKGNQGEYYLIATVDNNYYDSNFTAPTVVNMLHPVSGVYSVTSNNVPYIKSMATDGSSVVYSDSPLGFFDFRNDGVYTQVDPVQFSKLYDRVPKRAKAQEIISDNRIAYGNYTDGFDQVPIHFDLIPLYGADPGLVILDPSGQSLSDGISFGGEEIIEADPDNVNQFTEENYGEPPQVNITYNNADVDNTDLFPDADESLTNSRAICYNADAVKVTLTYSFPTITTPGQKINLDFNYRISFKYFHSPKVGKDDIARWPATDWANSWEEYRYQFFGAQIKKSFTVAADGIDGVVDNFVDYINGIQAQTTLDDSGQNDNPEAEDYNPNFGQAIKHYFLNDDGTRNTDPTTGCAEMRVKAEQDPNDTSKLLIHLVPQGQRVANDTPEEDGSCVPDEFNDPASATYVPENDGNKFACLGAADADTPTDYTLLDGERVTNLHVWRCSNGFNNNSYADFTECLTSSSITGGGCRDGGEKCLFSKISTLFPDGSNEGLIDNSTMSTVAGGNNPWSEFSDTNMSFTQMQTWSSNVSSFKSGAWHRFGLVYYDKEGRNSTVMLQEPSKSFPTRSSSTYVKFPPERVNETFLPQSFNNNGITNNALTEPQKLYPVDIGWRIWHKPPIWAHSYQWMYARNTSVGKFMQFTIDKAFINKGAKPGTSAADSQADTKLYISMNTMDGRIWSYSQRNRSLVGDWSFAEGDRMRIITQLDSSGTAVTMQNPSTGQPEYYDFKISEIGRYPGELVFNNDPSDTAANTDGITENVVLAPDSPVGGTANNPRTAELGKFIILDEPAIGGGFSVADADQATGKVKAWTGCIIEIYRPKKNLNEDESLYFEFSEKFDISDPGTDQRAHLGNGGDQSNVYTTDDDGAETTYNAGGLPASGKFIRGDIWYKPRTTRSVDETGNATFITGYYESYFLNDFLNTNHINIGRPNLSSEYATELKRSASVTYSDVFQVDTQFNGFHSFAFSQRPYIDYDISKGSIQKLISRDTDLILLQEDKVSTVLVNKDIITTPGGDTGIGLSKNVLSETARPATGEYGVCTNPESVAVYGKSFYFMDIKRGAVLRYSNDGLTAISEYKMVDFFRDKMDQYQAIVNPDRLGGQLKIVGGFDPRHGEYVLTFPNIYSTNTGITNIARNQFSKSAINFNEASKLANGVDDYLFNKIPVKDEEKDEVYDEDKVVIVVDNGREQEASGVTLAFNEKANRWTSFYTFYPEYYSSIQRTFVSFKFGNIYRHDADSTNHCMFHDNPYPEETRLSFTFNSEVSSVKGWNNISIEGIDRPEIIPIKGSFIQTNSGSTTVAGTGTLFTDNDIEVGDTINFYNDSGVATQIGTIQSVDSNTQITLTANATSTNATLYGAFIITAKDTLYKTKMTTNLNSTTLTHRTSYNNDSQSGNSQVAGSWVMKEDVGSAKIPYGETSSVGGEYFGLGMCSTSSGATSVRGNTLADGSGDSTNTTFTTAGINVGESIFYNNNGTETLIGVINTIVSNEVITLSSGATASLANTFMFVKKNSRIEGDRLKGHFMDTELTKRTKDKIHIFATNANVNKSELSNK